MTTRFRGIREAIEGFQHMRDHAVDAAAEGVKKHTLNVFAETQARVPRESGRLAGTGRVEEKPTEGTKATNTIWYGEPGEGPGIVDYAAAVHEILDAKHEPPTSAKYVEQPLIESVPAAVEEIGSQMRLLVKEAFKK